jgi:RimJ/RimL family protein N-acetyltransferase
MSDSYKTEEFKRVLEKIPQVKSIDTIEIKENIVKYITIDIKALGIVTVRQLDLDYSAALFDFYLKGLSEASRKRFYPYPLFDTLPKSAAELSERIKDWQKEDDWTVLNLIKAQQIIGVCFLKRFRTPQVTSGLALHEKYRKMGLGHLLQTIVNEQARFLRLKKFHVKVEPENIASLRLHEKCGFKQTRTLSYLGYKDGIRKEIPVIEMVLELSYE